ncbi:hypothetical protein M3P05_19195 [Sansalvadorimonas sp. 2012CJ34-2]|uniref:Uncharacterized protein n=1 Tax=Parendozoicomonas callyspongiae TaxID=2942213 RepID=A0ABT0PKY3_9GAMM|nr:hypothetical protein [Sansalvadorimonas sp. 2012CJ34-2]MCL6272052.1 hypothetical protein [Sansalvadorimonas sp. 2012CJ34-2]
MDTAFNSVSHAPYTEPLPLIKSCDSDLNTLFNTKLCEGKLLAKMLMFSFSEGCLDRAEQEYIQLSQGDKSVRCAATSLLAPCPKQTLYRKIGFIIDVDKSIQKIIANYDVGSMPVDDQGYILSWDKKEKRYKQGWINRISAIG